MKLEEIYELLKNFAEKEEDLQCKWPCDSDYIVDWWEAESYLYDDFDSPYMEITK